MSKFCSLGLSMPDLEEILAVRLELGAQDARPENEGVALLVTSHRCLKILVLRLF